MNYLSPQSFAATISFCGLIIAAYKIFDEQKKYHKIKYNQEKRLEYKLRIYEILINDILPIDQIITKFNNHSPLQIIDTTEIRKCVYEMIVEKSIISFEDGSYTVDTATITDDNENAEN